MAEEPGVLQSRGSERIGHGLVTEQQQKNNTVWVKGDGQEGIEFSSVQFSRSVVSDPLRHHESQHASLPCPSATPGVHSDSRPSSP